MQAIIYAEYGPPDVLKLTEVGKPTPKGDEVLLKIRAASVNPYDWHLMRGSPYPLRLAAGLRKPKERRFGTDVAGEVEAIGGNVTRFKPGDAVFGMCRGACAEYACGREVALAPKPSNLTFEQAAAVPMAGLTALQGLRDAGRLQPEQKVLVDGASGGVGTFAVQIAKALGGEVTAVCSSRNLATMRTLGATHIIDYTKEDFTRSGERYDLILAANAYHSIFDYRRALNPRGKYVMIGGGGVPILQALLLGPLISRLGSKKMGMTMTKRSEADLVLLKEMSEAEKITPIVDRSYPLSETAEAVRYLEEGHAKGKVIITLV